MAGDATGLEAVIPLGLTSSTESKNRDHSSLPSTTDLQEEFLSRMGLGFGPIGCSDGSRTVDQVLVDSVRGAQVERIESKVLFAIALEADANLDVPVES